MNNLATPNLAPADESVFDALDSLACEHDEILEQIEADNADITDEALAVFDELDNLPIEEPSFEEQAEEAADASEASIIEDFEPVEAAETVVEDETDESGNPILDDFELAELDKEIAKQEVYAEQAENSTIKISDPNAVATAKAAKKTRRTPAPGAGRKRLNRDLEALDKSLFCLHADPANIDDELQANYKKAFIDAMPAQVKVRDKIEQVMHGIANNQAPNRYVEIPFRLLVEKETVTHSDIVAAYKNAPTKDGSKSLGAGTASAQTGQIMVLFPYLGIAEVSGKRELTLRKDSTVAEKLKLALGM